MYSPPVMTTVAAVGTQPRLKASTKIFPKVLHIGPPGIVALGEAKLMTALTFRSYVQLVGARSLMFSRL